MTEIIYVSGSSVRFSSGKFDSSKRYVRQSNLPNNIPIAKGKTIDISHNATVPVTFRYSVNSYILQTTHRDDGNNGNTPISAGTFNAQFIKVIL